VSTVAPFSISRVLNAPRSLVYQVNTDAAHLAKWLSPAGFEVIKAALDLRVGGTYHYGLKSPDGKEMWGRQVFREIVPNERLVYIQSFSNPEGGLERHPFSPTWPLEMWAMTTFEDAGAGKTRLTVTWRPHEADEAAIATFDAGRPGMEQGFGGTFAKLESYLASLTAAVPSGSELVEYPTPTELKFTRVLRAPRTLVWRCHTEPERLAKWWGPQGFTITIHEIDVRPGGVWRLTLHGPDGRDYPNKIVYRELVEPQLLDYDHGDFEHVRFHVRTEFLEHGEDTKLVSRMTFASQAQRDATAKYAVDGHASTMQRLDDLLAQLAR
jgi:uncharacterized protein YndB with AHSA1/START domain